MLLHLGEKPVCSEELVYPGTYASEHKTRKMSSFYANVRIKDFNLDIVKLHKYFKIIMLCIIYNIWK